MDALTNDLLRAWLRENLQLKVDYEYGTNSVHVSLFFKGEDEAFTTDWIYIPGD